MTLRQPFQKSVDFTLIMQKLDTEVYGVDITGTLQSDTLIVTGVSTVAS